MSSHAVRAWLLTFVRAGCSFQASPAAGPGSAGGSNAITINGTISASGASGRTGGPPPHFDGGGGGGGAGVIAIVTAAGPSNASDGTVFSPAPTVMPSEPIKP